jgi:hypothetical protein
MDGTRPRKSARSATLGGGSSLRIRNAVPMTGIQPRMAHARTSNHDGGLLAHGGLDGAQGL